MNAVERKAQLIETMQTARAEIDKIERAERRAKSVALLGKYMKYPKNCYSCPQKPSDYWTVYRRILRMDKDGALHGVEFSKDSNGKVEVGPCTIYYPDSSGWVPCSKREFERARDRIVNEAQALWFA
jgi:hypothetical protein